MEEQDMVYTPIEVIVVGEIINQRFDSDVFNGESLVWSLLHHDYGSAEIRLAHIKESFQTEDGDELLGKLEATVLDGMFNWFFYDGSRILSAEEVIDNCEHYVDNFYADSAIQDWYKMVVTYSNRPPSDPELANKITEDLFKLAFPS